MIVKASAKINLALHITGQRADGYHTLESIVTFADVGDLLSFSAAREDRLTFSGPFGTTLAADSGANLVIKALNALRAHVAPRLCAPVAIHLEKNLPIASGIGGGSADAAATLLGLNQHCGLELSDEDLASVGSTLGADVPMCVYGRPLIAKGIGDDITVVQLPEMSLLLVNPGVAVSTAAIFKLLTCKENECLPSNPPQMTERMPIAGLLTYLNSTRNDLEMPAIKLQPIIADVLLSIKQSGALFARMSGSGATCFGIFKDKADAEAARNAIGRSHPDWWVA